MNNSTLLKTKEKGKCSNKADLLTTNRVKSGSVWQIWISKLILNILNKKSGNLFEIKT